MTHKLAFYPATLVQRAVLAIAWVSISLLAMPVAFAQDIAGGKDHPLIKRFNGSQIKAYASVDFDEATFPIKPFATQQSQATQPVGSLLKVEGKVTRINYEMPLNKSTLEVFRNYEVALGASFTTVFSCAGAACGQQFSSVVSSLSLPPTWNMAHGLEFNRYLVTKRSSAEGDVYVQIYVTRESLTYPALVYQQIVELKPMQTSQVTVLDAAALKTGLQAAGKIAVYGVHFDTGKADVKPESKPTLDEMAKLLNGEPGLKVYIVGHTDNAGTLAGNIDLSQRRADAIVRALTSTYKVDAQRLQAKGVASLAPVASNLSEAGRAKNRRVELVQQ